MEKEKKFDLIVIGGGPGGYPAAIRAAQHGLNVALVEAKELGGTCLNRGCIPSKTLIAGADVWHRLGEASEFGIAIGSASFDYSKMVERKNRIVTNIRKGLEGLIASNQITVFRGFGKLISPKEVKVIGTDNAIISAEKIIIATGSEPRQIASLPVDHSRVFDSTSLLDFSKLPKSILIIGGGIIGCEFASLFSLLGSEVTLIELLPRILPMEEKTVAEFITQSFKKRGIKIHTGVQVVEMNPNKTKVTVKLADQSTIVAEHALVAVGRSLNTKEIGLDKAGVQVSENGIIPTDDGMQTNVPGIYAVGDIASKWWLAHVASHQGIVAADNAAGRLARMHYDAIPSVIFTHPEIATVGMGLEDAKAKGYQATIGAFPFQALGKSQAAFQTEGFAQIVLDKRTGQILGAQVVGHEASTLIAEMALAVANELTIECVADTIHAHPTLAEAWLEAAFLGMDMPLHLPKKKKTS